MNSFSLAYQLAERAQVPLSVHFDLTHRCHQRCIHCYLPETWRRGQGPGPELDTVQVEGILEKLAAAGTFFLNFSGGEIFLRPDLLHLVNYARRLNFSVSLMTSGTLGLNEDRIKTLADLKITALLISLHSTKPDLHDRITRTPGSWRQVQKVIGLGRSKGLLVVVNSQILRRNLTSAVAMKEYAAGEGLPLRMDDNLSPRWDGTPHPEGLALTEEEREWVLRKLGGKYGPEVREPLTVLHDDHPKVCGAGLRSAYVNPQGVLMPCMEIRWPLARLGPEEDLITLWRNSSKLKKLRLLLEREEDLPESICVYLRKFRQYGPNPKDANN